MKTLWSFIDKKDWRAETKYRIMFLVLGALFGITGFLLWLVISNWVLAGWDWMFCFVGYAVIISYLTVFLYACNHEFHNGSTL